MKTVLKKSTLHKKRSGTKATGNGVGYLEINRACERFLESRGITSKNQQYATNKARN